MGKIIIFGLNNGIDGAVTLSGAKNSALKVLTASVLAEEEVVLDNIPLDIRDVRVTLQMLKAIGACVTEDRPGRVRIDWPAVGPQSDVPGEFGSIRTNLLFLGALLARTGRASVPLPGGDQIGERKHDLHLMAIRKLGAVCT
ncbi:MAG: UDP-N-acetylglucosamine 1-carboxyvinyltransferase, partial [Proteobacteria bacterium]|nr:UDP-N-acetylglucosamine 1-carboxyvinyltransferase [Pseudomonadota bacterium]